MIFETSQGSVVIDIDQHKNVGLCLSGGADSSLLLYMLGKVKQQTDIKIIPIVFQEEEKNYQRSTSDSVIKLVSDLLSIDIEHPIVVEPVEQDDLYVTKQIAIRNLFVAGVIDCCFNGVTANPPKDVCDQWVSTHPGLKGPEDIRFEDNRDLSFPFAKMNGSELTMYRPFARINKKAIAELYDQLGLTDNLFPLTRSCAKLGVHHVHHCQEECFWCFERHWGFGKY
jgi:PP-loop superfamily ATP-utilizing enzyme